MKEKHFITIIAIILIFGFVFYAVGNGSLSLPSSSDNESPNSLWTTSKNVESTSDSEGTHMKGTNNEACWSALKSGENILFLNSERNFTIEMDAKIDNMLAFYFVTSEESNGDIYIVPNNAKDFQHIQFNYSSVSHDMTYSVNGNVIDNMTCDFEGKLVGFKMIDWQGDMDVVVRNIFIFN